MPEQAPRLAKSAFTLAELLVTVAVVGVLGGLLLSLFARVQARGRTAQCVSNLRQWGTALNLYANDHDGAYPKRGQGIQPIANLDVNQLTAPDVWINALPPYFGEPGLVDAVHAGNAPKPGSRSVFVCPEAKPSASSPYFIPYAMNMYLSPTIRPQPHTRPLIPAPSQLAFLADGPVAWSSAVPSSQGYSVQARHSGHANVCFVDGHVASFDGAYLGCGVGQPNPERDDIRWHPNAGGIDQPAVP